MDNLDLHDFISEYKWVELTRNLNFTNDIGGQSLCWRKISVSSTDYGTLNFNRLSTTNSEIIEILRNKKELRKKNIF